MPFDPIESMLVSHATNNRINTFLIQNIPDKAWREKPPGGKGRDIASMVAHIHNVRLMWLKSAAANAPMPKKLEGEDFTKDAAIAALEVSRQAMEEVLGASLRTDGRIKGFKPDAGSFLAYLLAHDAHHRGQISMLARHLGHPISKSAMFGLWEWGTR